MRATSEIEHHPFLDLIRRPSADHTVLDFMESWYGFLLVSGNAYVEAVGIGGQLRELHALRPDRMKVLPGPDGWPEGYEYTADGRSMRLIPSPCPASARSCTCALFHPVNDYYGMSPIEAAAVAIEPTTQRPAGTRRYSTTPRGLPAHSCMPRAKAS